MNKNQSVKNNDGEDKVGDWIIIGKEGKKTENIGEVVITIDLLKVNSNIVNGGKVGINNVNKDVDFYFFNWWYKIREEFNWLRTIRLFSTVIHL